jgi:hypothetical protein
MSIFRLKCPGTKIIVEFEIVLVNLRFFVEKSGENIGHCAVTATGIEECRISMLWCKKLHRSMGKAIDFAIGELGNKFRNCERKKNEKFINIRKSVKHSGNLK